MATSKDEWGNPWAAAELIPNQLGPMAIELGWLRAMAAMRDAVKEMPGETIDRRELLTMISYLAKNPKTY
jgi:hypothetical protein